MAGVAAEVAAAVTEVFHEMGDLAKVTLRRYRKGITPGAVVSGAQGRLPVGAPKVVTGIVTRGRPSVVYLQSSSLGSAADHLNSPSDEWTVEVRGEGEMEVVGGSWSSIGPDPGAPQIWRATLVDLKGKS